MEGQTLTAGSAKSAKIPQRPPQATINKIDNGYLITCESGYLFQRQFCAKDFDEAVELLKKIFQSGVE